MGIINTIQNNQELLKHLGCDRQNIKITKLLYVGDLNGNHKIKLNDEIVLNCSQGLIKKPIGFIIKNIGNKPIKNIYIPKYNSEPAIEEITLNPNQEEIIPFKWLVLLLFRPEFGLETINAKFIDNEHDDYSDLDNKFSNYDFETKDLIDQENIGVFYSFKEDHSKGIYISTKYKNRFKYLENDKFKYNDSLCYALLNLIIYGVDNVCLKKLLVS